MAIKLGTSDPSNIRLGNNQVDRIYLGSNVVWEYFLISAPNAFNNVFRSEPAPPSETVTAGSTVSVQGGLAPLSYSWTYVSGDTAIQPTGLTTYAQCNWSASVFKNTSISAVWRITVTDSLGSRSQNITVELAYSTDI